MTVSPGMPIWPGTKPPDFMWLGRVEKEGYNLTEIRTNLHVGTHADSPSHWVAGGDTIDILPLTLFAGTARLFRRRILPKKLGDIISLDELVSNGFSIKEGEILVIDCRLDTVKSAEQFFNWFPVPSQELLSYLKEKKIKTYMSDAPAVDRVGDLESPGHKSLLGNGIPIVENLVNLSELKENLPFFITAFPLNLEGREGGLCRAAAFISE